MAKELVKGNELLEFMQSELSWHRARLKFVVLFVLAVLKTGLVSLPQIAGAMDSAATKDSKLKRIRRFLGGFEIVQSTIAKLLVKMSGLNREENWVLTLDRTNWKFGATHINMLVLGVAYRGVAIPLFWTVWNRAGNSRQEVRIALINRFLACFGRERVACLVADREFVGKKWFAYLEDRQLSFGMRLKENQLLKKRLDQSDKNLVCLFSQRS